MAYIMLVLINQIIKKEAVMKKIFRQAIEYNATEHCNLKCENCAHSSDMMPPKFTTLKQFEKDLKNLSKVLHANELKIVGGEPLLHPKLLDLINIASEIKIADQITLITNGILLNKMSEKIWEKIDGMWISVYPNTVFKHDFKKITKLANKHDVWIWRKWTPYFVQQLLDKKIDDKEMLDKIYKNCSYVHNYFCNALHEGYFYKCEQSVFMKKRLSLLNIEFDNANDRLEITDEPDFKEKLENFLNSRKPLNACSYCLGSIGRFTRHRKSKKNHRKKYNKNADLVNQFLILPDRLKEKIN